MRVREKVGWAAWGAFALAVAFGVRGTFEAVRRGAGPAVMIRSRSVVASAAASNVSGGGTTSSRHNQSAGDVYDVFESPGPAVPFGVPGRAARPAGGGPVRAVGGQPFAPDQLFAAASPAVGVVEVKDRRLTAMGQGSGFFVSADGLLVTNYHVIAGGFAATVRSGEGRLFRVDGVAAVDAKADLALLKVSVGRAVPYLAVATAPPPVVGTRVFAIGNPRGMANTLSDGLVSGMRAFDDNPNLTFIQTSAPISPGSSGGPLLTADAQVIGVTTAGLADAQNLNFAVPAEHVRRLVKSRGSARAIAEAAPRVNAWEGADALNNAATFIERGHYTDAQIALDLAKDEHAGDPFYWLLVGALHELGQRDYEMAIDAYRRSIALDPKYVKGHDRLGRLLMSRKKYAEAIDVYRAASRLEPTNPGPFKTAGDAAQRMGDPARALAFYDRAAKLMSGPPSPHFHYDRGTALAALGRDDEAMNEFLEALREQSSYVNARNAVGDLHLKHRRVAEAKEAYDFVAGRYPRLAHAHLKLGEIAEREGNLMMACILWERAARAQPDSPAARTARAHLSRVGSDEARTRGKGKIIQ